FLIAERKLLSRAKPALRAGSLHAERGLVEVEDRFLLLPFGLVLLAQPDDGTYRLGIEARAFHFGKDFLDVVGNGLLFLLQALDALDERAELACGHGLAGLGDFVGQFSSPDDGPRLGRQTG